MVNKLLFCMIIILVAPVVLADTPITVNTLKDHTLSIIILDPTETYSSLESFHLLNSGADGKVTVATAVDMDTIDVFVIIRKDGVKILSERLTDFSTESAIDINLYPKGFEPETVAADSNYTEEDTTVKTLEEDSAVETFEEAVEESEEIPKEIIEKNTEEPEFTPEITGAAVSESLVKIPVVVYFIIAAAIIAAFFILFFSKRLMRKRDPAYNYKAIKDFVNVGDTGKDLMDAEKKLKEAQAEISRIKNKDQIFQAEKKIKEEMEKLEKLKRGES
jgi:ABC-type Na+ efflux pump permease subunit